MRSRSGLLLSFLILGSSLLSTVPITVEAQQTGKVARVGVLSPGSPPHPSRGPLQKALRELGWVEGEKLVLESRYAEGRLERLPELATELVRLGVDVLVPMLNEAIGAATRATTSIPIVMFLATDPVGTGFVANLAKPGGNVTGTTSNMPEVTGGKALEALKAALPTAHRIAILLDPNYPGMPAFIKEANAAGRNLGVKLQYLEVRSPQELSVALGSLRRARPDALDVLATGSIFARRHEILTFAAEHKLPTMWPGIRQLAEEGALMTYGFTLEEMAQRTVAQIAKILNGAKPADLPVEQPTKFELVINLKTAKALGLTIPPSLLLRADHILE